MKILCLACIHGDQKYREIPLDDIDMILIAGDIGKADKARELRMENPDSASLSDKISIEELENMIEENISSTESLLYHFSQKPTYFIYGNSDNTEESIESEKNKYGLNIIPLEDRVKDLNVTNISQKIITTRGIEIAGLNHFVETFWLKNFLGTDKHRTEEERVGEEKAKRFFSELEKVDILLTHLPPYENLDLVDNLMVPKSWNGKHAGSQLLLNYIEEKQPKYVICGHIHEANGKTKIGETEIINVAQDHAILHL